jgi:hypothetical protein
MSPTERDYELVGRWLDGEEVSLTPGQRALGEEIASGAAEVGAALDVAMPAGALHRAHGRLAVRPRVPRVGRLVAAAAAVVVAAGLLIVLGTRPEAGVSPQQYVASFLGAPAGDFDARAELLTEELAACRMELALADSWPLELALQGLEDDIRRFDPSGFDPAEGAAEEEPDEAIR